MKQNQLFSEPIASKTRVLSATLQFIRGSIFSRDFSAIAEGMKTFNALGMPWIMVGVHNMYVHVTCINDNVTFDSDKQRTYFPLTMPAGVMHNADVIWRLGSDGRYVLVKDRTGLYKGHDDV